jgi:SAM-dependent methyltransferase
MTFGAIRELETLLGPGHRVLEYGSGASTLFFAQRVALTVSIEHDPAWYAAVRARCGDNVELLLILPTSEAAGDYTSTDERFVDKSFRDYAAAADHYADGYFDVALIDGRARPSCFRHARSKVRPGGWIILDDSERESYREVVHAARFAGWIEHAHWGPNPYVPQFGQTTIWQTTGDGGDNTSTTKRRSSQPASPM